MRLLEGSIHGPGRFVCTRLKCRLVFGTVVCMAAVSFAFFVCVCMCSAVCACVVQCVHVCACECVCMCVHACMPVPLLPNSNGRPGNRPLTCWWYN